VVIGRHQGRAGGLLLLLRLDERAPERLQRVEQRVDLVEIVLVRVEFARVELQVDHARAVADVDGGVGVIAARAAEDDLGHDGGGGVMARQVEHATATFDTASAARR
jgi:hypothetical protein